MSHFDPNFVYHLHVFSQAMPSFKGFFDTREAALTYFGNYLSDNFPLEELEVNRSYLINDLLANSANIVKIDKRVCKNYKNLFKIGLRRRIAKYYNMIVREGDDE